MDKLGTYALVAALRGLAENNSQTRRCENDRWISLQASTLPQLDMTCMEEKIDTPAEEAPVEQQLTTQTFAPRPYISTSYLKELNRRHDAAARGKRR